MRRISGIIILAVIISSLFWSCDSGSASETEFTIHVTRDNIPSEAVKVVAVDAMSDDETVYAAALVSNGSFSIRLPEIPSKFLVSVEDALPAGFEISDTGTNLLKVKLGFVSKEGDMLGVFALGNMRLNDRGTDISEVVQIMYVYSDRSCVVKGTVEDQDASRTYVANINLSRGWNRVALIVDLETDTYTNTTNMPASLKWIYYKTYTGRSDF